MLPIISVEIMKAINEREMQTKKSKKSNDNKRKTNKGRKEQGEQKL